MKRRGFLKALLGIVALDPERLLWVPGQKLISIPSPVVFQPSGNRLLTIDMVTREALKILEQNLTFAKAEKREYRKVGSILNVRTPALFRYVQ